MGNPLSKGPMVQVEKQTNERFSIETVGTSNFDNLRPATYNHGVAVVQSLNLLPLTALPEPNQHLGGKSKREDADFSYQSGGKRQPLPPEVNILDLIPEKEHSFVGTQNLNSFHTLPTGHVDIGVFRNGHRKSNLNLNDPIRKKYHQNNYDEKNEVILFPNQQSDQELPMVPANGRQNHSNVNPFFENAPTIVMKGRETKAARRKREADEMAGNEGQKKMKDVDDYFDEDKLDDLNELKKHNLSDWEQSDVEGDPFVDLYLGTSSGTDTEEIEQRNMWKKLEKKPIPTRDSDESEDDDDDFDKSTKDKGKEGKTTQKPRVTKEFKPGAKSKHRTVDYNVMEPPRGKGSFGRIEMTIAERKKRMSAMKTTMRDMKSTKPDFEIMDPGDGEDDWGAKRQLEPPPETVVVPWVPYGWKKVEAKDGTVSYTLPDTVYEKFTMTNLGYVKSEPMTQKEIDNYIREEKEREEQKLEEERRKVKLEPTDPSSSSPSDSDDEASSYKSSDLADTDDYDMDFEGFYDPNHPSNNVVYGIPTSNEPYDKDVDNENYLSDADEDQPFKTRPVVKEDLEEYLGDVVKAFRIENPAKGDKPVDFFEAITKKSCEDVQNNLSTKSQEKVEDSDYNDGFQEGVLSTDEYDDNIPNAHLLLKDYNEDDTEKNADLVMTGLYRVELKETDWKDHDLILEGADDNYEDDDVEVDYDDGLYNVKVNTDIKPKKLGKVEILHDSDEDIDPSDESENYDSEEDDYEDNVREVEYNDGLPPLNKYVKIESDSEEELDSEDEAMKLFEDITPEERVAKLENVTDNIDPEFFDEQVDSDDIDDDDPDEKKREQTPPPWANEGEDETISERSEESSDYDPQDGANIGDAPIAPPDFMDEEIVQNHNPVELMEEMERQGDKFDDFEYSMENGTWVDFPYKHPGDAVEAQYDRGEPGAELPYWYFIRHPAEDESLMNIRAKLADQYDAQTGPYNPFKVDPPPTPHWVDDTYDLVPKGVEVPDDFFYGFQSLDPETLHKMQMEEDEFPDGGGEEEFEEADGRYWSQGDRDDTTQKRTWSSWKARPDGEPVGQTDATSSSSTSQTQKTPKKNDQWQHYRDWLLRQGTKSTTSAEERKDLKANENVNSNASTADLRFSGKKITERHEKVQPRPHYQTWLSKQVELKNVTNRPPEIQKPTHRRFEEAFVDDKRQQNPSKGLFQHYKTWKEKDDLSKTETSPNTKTDADVDYFVFSRPPENKSNSSPYSKPSEYAPKNIGAGAPKNEMSGLDHMKLLHNLNENITPKPKSLSDNHTTVKNSYNTLKNSSMHEPPLTKYSRTDVSPTLTKPLMNSGNSISIPFSTGYISQDIDKCESVGKKSPLIETKNIRRGFIRLLKTPRIQQQLPKTHYKTRAKQSPPLHPSTHILQIDNNLNVNFIDSFLHREVFPIQQSNTLDLAGIISRDNKEPIRLDSDAEKTTSSGEKIKESILNEQTKNSEVEVKAKRKYTRRKPLANNNGESPIAVPISDKVVLKRKYTRRLKTAPDVKVSVPEIKIDGHYHNQSNQVNEKDSNDTQTILSGELLNPKRKYTRRKLRSEESYTEKGTDKVLLRTRNTRRSKTLSEVAHSPLIVKIDDSPPGTLNQENNNVSQNNPPESPNALIDEVKLRPFSPTPPSSLVPTSEQTYPNKIDNSPSVFHKTETILNQSENNVSKNDHDDNKIIHPSLTLPSFESESPSSEVTNKKQETKTQPVTIYNDHDDNEIIHPSLTLPSFESESPSSEVMNKKQETQTQPVTTYSNVRPKLPSAHSQTHWQHYESYEAKYIKQQTPPHPYASKPSAYRSQVYPPIHTKVHGDHWTHYKDWLQKNGIKRLIFKTPTSRGFLTEGAPSFVEEQQTECNSVQSGSLPKEEAAEMTNEQTMNQKIELLHQRWLAWQQNLSSKMVNKLNKMLKYYEDPDGNVTHDTIKVIDMIKQRDYWREIHRWTSKKGFTLFNKTPPQTRPIVNQDLLQKNVDYKTNGAEYPYPVRAQPQRKNWNTAEQSSFNVSQYWTKPDVAVETSINENKRPKFPLQHLDDENPKLKQYTFTNIYSERKPKFPSFATPESSTPVIRPKFPNQENNFRDYGDYDTRKINKNKLIRERQYTRREADESDVDGLDVPEDRFFREICDMLGQEVKVEEKAKKSKSRAQKDLERRTKAKNKALRKERNIAKKFGQFMFKGMELKEEEEIDFGYEISKLEEGDFDGEFDDKDEEKDQ